MGHGVRAALVASTVSALVGQLRDYLGEIRVNCFPGSTACGFGETRNPLRERGTSQSFARSFRARAL
jgi:hypothetical protein